MAKIFAHPVRIAWLLALAVLILACDSPTDPANAPEGHTDVKGGAAHAPGSNNPLVNCISCHGPTLEGGDDGEPSCFSCHGRVW